MVLITRVNDVYKLTHAPGGAHIDGLAVLKWGYTVWGKKKKMLDGPNRPLDISEDPFFESCHMFDAEHGCK